MDDPIGEIGEAINRCAAAPSTDVQIEAFRHYFTHDASFLHPLCYIPSSEDSTTRVIGIFMFFRTIVPKTSFDIQHVCFDESTLHLYVGLVQRPEFLLLRSLGWVPTVPMHVHFHLRKSPQGYLIDSEEDLVSIRSVLMCIPGVSWFVGAFYFLCEVLGLLNAWLFGAKGGTQWKPVNHVEDIPREMKKHANTETDGVQS